MNDTTRRIAVVTGGSAGIGRSVAETLARDGWRVLACARRTNAAAELARAGVELVQCDVADAADVAALAARMAAEGGRVGALVNSAGIMLERAGFADSTEDDMRRLFEINVFGTMRMVRQLLPMMGPPATIVNLSSTLAARPRPGTALYAATKGAVERFSASLATEVAGQGIRVHVIAPALVRSRIWIETGMTEAEYDALLADRAAQFPLGRVGEPEDVSELVAFLVSDKAGWMTGTLIPVDGGAMLR